MLMISKQSLFSGHGSSEHPFVSLHAFKAFEVAGFIMCLPLGHWEQVSLPGPECESLGQLKHEGELIPENLPAAQGLHVDSY